MVMLTLSTKSSFMIEIATLVLLGNVLIHLDIGSNGIINILSVVQCIKTLTNNSLSVILTERFKAEMILNANLLTDIVAKNDIQQTIATGTLSLL